MSAAGPAMQGRWALRFALGLALGACGAGAGTAPGGAVGSSGAPVEVPVRAPTAGDALLALAPWGASGVLELDLARLRGNPTVGPAVHLVLDTPPAGDLDARILRQADAVLLCSYAMGHDEAATLTLVRGPDLAALGKGDTLDAHTVALGPPALLARVQAVRVGQAEPLATDRALMAVRARAMPARAEGASVRVAARLDFEARVALASRFDLAQVPTTISVWGDVADDLAVVAHLGGADAGEADGLTRASIQWRDRLATSPWARARGLAPLIRSMDIATRGTATHAVFLIGPRQLVRLVERLTSGANEP